MARFSRPGGSFKVCVCKPAPIPLILLPNGDSMKGVEDD